MLNLFNKTLKSRDLEDAVRELQRAGGATNPTGFALPKKVVKQLCKQARSLFLEGPTLVNLPAGEVTIVGDLHGQFEDLLHIFERYGMPPKRRYLFLGDYVDRGARGLEIMALLFALKLQYPDKVTLLRGNHECRGLNAIYGFQDECRVKADNSVWQAVNDVFDVLPLAALLDQGRILAVHGGHSFHLYKLKQIQAIKRPLHMEGQPPGLATDLLWSDPKGEDFKGWANNPRGSGYLFGMDTVQELKSLNPGLQHIVRSHQPMEMGVEKLGEHDDVITVFSAPNYRGGTNLGAVMHLHEDGAYDFSYMDGTKAGPSINNQPSVGMHDMVRRSAPPAHGDTEARDSTAPRASPTGSVASA